jgi:hypothetical protein
LRKICDVVNVVFSQAEFVFVLENYLALKSFAVVREALSNAYRNNEVGNTE